MSCTEAKKLDEADVVVIGGGPAGSTASTLLAQKGLQVQLFEREKFPRFHIGESLIPETYWVLERLNMLPKMRASHFVHKHSVRFVSGFPAKCRLRSTSTTISRTNVRRHGRWSAVNSIR